MLCVLRENTNKVTIIRFYFRLHKYEPDERYEEQVMPQTIL
jgi:hypothetical protein